MLRRRKWQHLAVIPALLLCASCTGRQTRERQYDAAQDLFRRRQWPECLELSRSALRAISRERDPDLHFRFRLLEAASLIGLKEQKSALIILSEAIPSTMLGSSEAVLWRMNQGMAHLFNGDNDKASHLLEEALHAAKQTGSRSLVAEVEARLGAMALRKKDNGTAETLLRRSLDVATQEGNTSLRTSTLVNLGLLLTQTFRLQEAVYWQEQAAADFRKTGDTVSLARVTGNLGWSYLRLGDLDAALDRFKEAESQFEKSRNRAEQLMWLGSIGNVHLQRGDHAAAEASYTRAVELAREMGNKLELSWWLGNLASVAITRRDWQRAEALNEEVAKLAPAKETPDSVWMNNTAAIAAGCGRAAEAEALYKKVAATPSPNPLHALLAHSGLAAMYADLGNKEKARREYQATLALVDRERERPLADRFKLPYLGGRIRFYQQYVDFLVREGNIEPALRVADSSHARILAGAESASAPDYRILARKSRSVLLAYWLAPERSFLWEITPNDVKLHVLPDASKIRSLISRHNSSIASLRSTLDPGWGAAGQELWDVLIGPVAGRIPRAGRVIIVPDGSLYSLNMESLPVAKPAAHYWLEDATISIVPALRLLRPNGPASTAGESLLLIGDPDSSGPEFPRLAFAAQEVAEIEKHFSRSPRLTLRGKDAHPAAYGDSSPSKFSLVHFAAHASSNSENPLQSAIVLSRHDRQHLLLAAEVMKIPLRARLVTISACGSAGARIYSGEGLVGLTWAFQRAGAQAVIAGLWDVPDGATSKLMGNLYARLATGQPPDQALREAKMAMLAGGSGGALPYNWAAFQHYAGSY